MSIGTIEERKTKRSQQQEPAAARSEAEERLRTFFEYAPEAVVMFDVQTGRFIDANPKAEELFGLSRVELCEVGPFDLSPTLQPDGRLSSECGKEKIAEVQRGAAPEFEWWHRNAQGEQFPCEVRLVRMPWGDRMVVRGSITDISERKRLELLERGKSQLLQRIAQDEPLARVLLDLTRTIEDLLPGNICSVLILDQATSRLRHGAGPSIPRFYNDAVDGLEIGPAIGSCGAAAFTAKRVVVTDVMSHPNWSSYRELANKAQLRACWSEPIISLTGTVLGTVATYYREPRAPAPVELKIIEVAAPLAAIAIEHEQTQRVIRMLHKDLEHKVADQRQELTKSNRELLKNQEDLRLAAVAFKSQNSIVVTDKDGEILRVNESFTRMTGYTTADVIGKTPRILKSGLHNDEFYRQMWEAIGADGYWQGEVWNKRKDGQVYPQWLTITSVKDESGSTTHYVGDGRDITAEKRAAADREAIGVARQIQISLFPPSPPCLPGFDIAASVFPAEHVSGDYFDFLPLGQTSLGVVVGDVSGHGLGPALLMAQTQANLRSLFETHGDPGDILTGANRLTRLGSADRFATVFLGRIDVVARTLVYAGAGHQGYLIDKNGRTTTLESTGYPLGVVEGGIVTSQATVLQSGDILVITTDGVDESRNPEGMFFGRTNALDVVCANRDKSAADIVQAVFDEVRDFSEGVPQHDDMTVLIAKAQDAT